MARARKEGAVAQTVSEGVKHARALDAAIDYYRAQLPDSAEESKNWPFGATVPHIIGQLNNL